MKTLKSLFMLCAGLSFCACSSDNDGKFPEGTGAVTVKLANPFTRAETTATGGQNGGEVVVSGPITVNVYENGDHVNYTKTGTIDASSGEITFYGVSNPTLVTASVNGGIDPESAAYANKSIGDCQSATAQTVPAFGKAVSNQIIKTQDTEIHEGTTYQKFTATVEMAVPYARIEFSVKRDENPSTKFTKLDLGGVYLDNLLATGGDTEGDDYKHPGDVDIADPAFKTTATGDNAILCDTPNANNPIDFAAANAVAPADSKVYAYNIYPGDVMPLIKIWFKNAAKTDETVLPYQYAVVHSYGNLTKFEKGKIYRITADALTDANIKSVESGTDADYAIEVTVEEAKWTIVDANASWQ